MALHGCQWSSRRVQTINATISLVYYGSMRTTTYKRLSLEEREEISKGIWADESFVVIAQRIKRSTSTITREVWGNVVRRVCYSATLAHGKAQTKRTLGRRHKKLEQSPRLKEYVYEKLRCQWSPEEIVKRVKLDYPEDTAMRISHESIYRHLYCLPKGELKKELMRSLRWQRKRRLSREALHYRRQRIPDLIRGIL